MDITIRQAEPGDIDEGYIVCSKCFPAEEMAPKQTYLCRIATFPESFYVAETDGRIVGLINGCLTNHPFIYDKLYETVSEHDPQGENQTILDLVVDPDYRCQGIAEKLMHFLILKAREAGRKQMVLTCKEHLIHYYEKLGYVNHGVSESTYGGARWYDMVMVL